MPDVGTLQVSLVSNRGKRPITDAAVEISSAGEPDKILEILKTDGKAFTRPWFGQLMTGPQLMAYLCQVNMWLERYNPKIEI